MMYTSVHSQRYGKAKGMKVKHLVQLVALTVLFTWFLYQLNSSHRAKVLSRHTAAESEELVDDELLISDDHFRVGDDERIAAQAVAQDEFIDRKSVLKSRKTLPVVDTTELDQFITEMERVDDTLRAERVEDLGLLDDDLTRSDVDAAAAARRTAEEDADSKREVIRRRADALIGHKHRRAAIAGGQKEFDGKSNLTTTTVGDDEKTSIFTTGSREDIAAVTSVEQKTPPDPIADEGNNVKPAGGDGSESNRVDRKRNLSKHDDSAAMEHPDGSGDETKPFSGATTATTRDLSTKTTDDDETRHKHHHPRNSETADDEENVPTKPKSSSERAALAKQDNSRKPSVVDESESGFPPGAEDEPGDGPVPLQNGADGEAVQPGGDRHYSAVAFHGDGGHEGGNGTSREEGAIAEVVVSGVSRQSAIAEVVSVAEQDQTEGA